MRVRAAVVACVLPFVSMVLSAQDALAPRPAKDILRDFDRVRMPSMSDGSDPESVRRFKAAIEDGCARQAAFALELQQGHPDHPRLPAVLDIRWAGMSNARGLADEVAKETAALLAKEGLRADVREMALLARARAVVASDDFTDLERIDAVRATIAIEGQDDRLAHGIIELVERHIADPATQQTLFEVVVDTWPKAKYGTRDAKALLRLHAAIGKPFVDLLPEANRAWFAEQTKVACEFTVVQLWMGWLDREGKDEDLTAMQAMREQYGDRLRLLGLVNGDLDERMPELKQAGVDWPQVPIESPEPMRNPFGAPKCHLFFVLDRSLNIVGIVGRATLVAERLDQLLTPAK
ncbi:MAG: hypothetical protein JNK15_06255 [Planctomycetes bacterium]|nr:hypothetical protein [Planctomycetota bacterium]